MSAPNSPETGGSPWWLFPIGLLVFAAGALAFLADVWTDHPIARSLLVNGVGAAVLVGWAAWDTLGDPDSSVETLGGAVGTGLILLGLYAVGVGLVVAATSPVHGRLYLGLALIAAGVPVAVGGVIVLPFGAVPGGTGADESPPDESDE